MEYNRFNAWRIAAIYIGSIVGAGFASGQEILGFFVAYHTWGILGAVIAGIVLGSLVIGALRLARHYQVETFQDLSRVIMGPRFSLVINLILALYLWTGLGIMIAGSTAVFVTMLETPPWLGLTLSTLCVAFALMGGNKGVSILNSALIPYLLLITISMSLILIIRPVDSVVMSSKFSTMLQGSWLGSAVLYSSYNLILAVAVLIPFAQEKDSIKGAVLGGVGFLILSVIVILALLKQASNVVGTDLPLLYLATIISPVMRYLYVIALWMAMISTAVGNGFGLTKQLEKAMGLSPGVAAGLVIMSVAPIATFNFASLVNSLYPLLGYFGLIIVIGLLYQLYLLKC